MNNIKLLTKRFALRLTSESSSSTSLAMLNEVDYLLIAKPVAFNHLKIRRDCARSFVDCAGCW